MQNTLNPIVGDFGRGCTAPRSQPQRGDGIAMIPIFAVIGFTLGVYALGMSDSIQVVWITNVATIIIVLIQGYNARQARRSLHSKTDENTEITIKKADDIQVQLSQFEGRLARVIKHAEAGDLHASAIMKEEIDRAKSVLPNATKQDD